MTGSDDRPRGILSSSDRAFLRGEKEYQSESGEREARRRIRERIRNGLLDFGLLFAHLDQRDRKQVLREYGQPDDLAQYGSHHSDHEPVPPELEWDLVDPDGFEPVFFLGGMRHTLGFVFLCLLEYVTEQLSGEPDTAKTVIEEMVAEAFADALARKEVLTETNATLTLNEVDINVDQLRERAERGQQLTDQEVQLLIYLRELAHEEMVAHVREEENPDRD